ncbi:unnamed protein product [Mytilus edulis]|uniref:Serine/threonine-protein kinase 11-interacting protein n=1 Tax=Mytilus edulis TaxID=6550 RepID=A0A8S3PQW2_MYTED|nr:unnamed protein product [Mytilus edulis]
MKGKEYELVDQLALLLRKNGDRILSGESKLSLTTQSLSLLNVSFRRYSDAKNNEPSRNRSHRDQMEKWKFNVQYLHDFITKTISLKITHSTATMQGPILISRFRSVEVLELKKVPIHMLEGLHRLRGQMKIIIVSRCLNSLQDLFEACGGDQSSPMSWPCLKSIFLSYNGLRKLDSSLRLLPVLEVIDISHNDLERTENYLELSLQGNPLSFHDSHRPLTVQYISIASGNNLEFTLDGKKITATERLLTQRSVMNLSRRPSWESQSSTINGTRQKEVVSSSYNFDESDDIATNLRRGSPRGSRRKKKARPKTALISDEEVIDSSMNEYSSPESSRAPSPEKEDEPDTAQSTKEEIQMLRDHYGVNWLQVIAAKKEDTLASSSSSKEVDKTEDDIYLNESVANLSVSGSRKETQNYTEVTNKDTEDDIEVLPEPTVSEEDTVQMRQKPKLHSVYSIYKDTSLQGSEWNRISQAEESEYYGAESELFIVMLPSEKLKQLIISVNNRYLIEKDLNGQIVELLDLKCMVSFLISMETVDHENISEEISLPVCKIKFDYTRKDRRDRTYVMEDADIAKEFQNLLQPFIDAKDVERQMKDLLQCLKCSNQFDKSAAEIKIQVPDKKHFNSYSSMSKGDSTQYICPKCKSEMVVELDTKELPTSLQNTPIGSYVSGDNFLGTSSKGFINGNIISGSPVAKSSPKKEKDNRNIGMDELDGTTEGDTVQLRTKTKEQSSHNVKRNRSFRLPELKGTSDAEDNVQLRPKTEGHDLYRKNREKSFQELEQKGIYDTDESEYNGNKEPSAVMSNSAMISGTERETVIQKSYSTGTAMCDMDRLQADDENPEYIRNSSWSGVKKSNSHRVLKRSSIDSDITILTNDSSSIGIISESTNESSSIAVISESSNDMIADRILDVFSDNSEAKSAHNLTLPVRKTGLNSSQNCEILDDYESCLKCIENQPITELQYIDIGLGYQSLRFEFSTECSSFTFLIRDEGRCKYFINLITSIVQDTAFSENSKLQGISKYNAETLENLTSTIAESDEEEDGQFELVRYLCGILVEEEDIRVSVGLAITEDELILVTENYQWPLPRLQAPLDAEFKGQQFTIRDCQKINNIATVETCEDDTTQIRLTFFNEESQQEVCWHIAMTTDSGVLSLINAVREPWKNAFGVDLDVTPVSFLSNSL